MPVNCTRKLEFDAAHRVMRHESKCANLHGHRYVLEITAESDALDTVGRVVDFSVIKKVVGGWIDDNWDHGAILNSQDEELIRFCKRNSWKVFELYNENPTAENMARFLFARATTLLSPEGVKVRSVRLYETPNGWSDFP